MKKYLPYILLLSVLILDQTSKYLTQKYIREGGEVKLIDDIVVIRHDKNEGIIFGLGRELPDDIRAYLFTGLLITAIAFVIYFYRSIHKNKLFVRSCFGLILGGAFGNLFDRLFGYILFEGKWKLFYGKVIDMINVGIPNGWRWATFNVADSAVTVAVIMLIFYILIKKDDNIFITKKKDTNDGVVVSNDEKE